MRRLAHELRLFAVAVQFFTRIPVALAEFEPAWLNECARYLPLVGMVVGGLGAEVLVLGAWAWPTTVAVVLQMAATACLTGGLHEDGLADTLDGLGATPSRQRALEIMKDSRLGSYGVMALGFVLAAKAGATLALCALGIGRAAAGIVLAHVVSRAMPVILMRALPYAGEAAQAKARPFTEPVSAGSLRVALVIAAIVAALALIALPAGRILGALAASLAVAGACAHWFRRRLGGFTGDTLGATQQCCELAILLALSVR